MNIVALKQLRELIPQIPDHEFDMGFWCRKVSFGTQACALGHFILKHPEYGLEVRPNRDMGEIWFQDRVVGSFYAASEIFGIDGSRFYKLFVDPSDRKEFMLSLDSALKEAIAEKLRKILNGWHGL